MQPLQTNSFQARCNARLQQQPASSLPTTSRVEELSGREGEGGYDDEDDDEDDDEKAPWSTTQCGPAAFSPINCESCGDYLGQGFDANCRCGECPIPPSLPLRECGCQERGGMDVWEERPEFASVKDVDVGVCSSGDGGRDGKCDAEGDPYEVDTDSAAFPAVVMQAECMRVVPAGLRTDWVCRPVPLGLRVLLKTVARAGAGAGAAVDTSAGPGARAASNTYTRPSQSNPTSLHDAATGECVLEFLTNIPADTVLDAIYSVHADVQVAEEDGGDDNSNASTADVKEYTTIYGCVHVLDVLRFADRRFMHVPHETREHFLRTKFEEEGPAAWHHQHHHQQPATATDRHPSAADEGAVFTEHMYAVRLVPAAECTYDSLLALYETTLAQLEMQERYSQAHYVALDGLQFCHKAALYEVGNTPWVLHFRDEITAPTARLGSASSTAAEGTDGMALSVEFMSVQQQQQQQQQPSGQGGVHTSMGTGIGTGMGTGMSMGAGAGGAMVANMSFDLILEAARG